MSPPFRTWGESPLLLVLLLSFTVVIYWTGLHGPFVFDDYNNIVNGPFRDMDGPWLVSLWESTVAGEAGPLKRPLSMASFGVNALLTGLDPFWFKLTNLGIHLLNGVLAWRLSRALLAVLERHHGLHLPQRGGIALAVAGLWLLHPMQLTSVLYVVQRMTSLSATFVLLGLISFLKARSAMMDGHDARLRLWLGVPLCLVLAALAKESGILLLLFCWVIEFTLLDYRSQCPAKWGTPRQFQLVFVGLPMLLIAGYLLTHPAWFQRAEAFRGFTVVERLLTETRVLWLYVKLLLVPEISQYALYYDDIPLSRSLASPPSTLWALAGWLLLVAGALRWRRRYPLLCFGVCWFLAGHAMESSVVMLELVHLHRNYLAFLGPLLALVVGLATQIAAPRTTYVLLGLIIVALGVVTAIRADQWRNSVTLAQFEVRHRPLSPRANYEAGRVMAGLADGLKRPELKQDAERYLRRASELAPREISGLVGLGMIASGPIPDDVFDELRARLTRRAVNVVDVNYIRTMMKCISLKACAVPGEQVKTLFGLMLAHPGVMPAPKAALLSILGAYYANTMADVTGCIGLMRQAVELQPGDLSIRLNLAQAYLFVPDFDAAEAEVARVERDDLLNTQGPRLRTIRKDLARMRANAAKLANAPGSS